MTKYGSAFSATDPLRLAPGTSHNAKRYSHCNFINLVTDGGTTEDIKIAQIGPANQIEEIWIEASGNLSTINFQIGTPSNPSKYGPAAAGPNATRQVRLPPITLGIALTTETEEIIITPSGALPSTGTIKTNVVTSHR